MAPLYATPWCGGAVDFLRYYSRNKLGVESRRRGAVESPVTGTSNQDTLGDEIAAIDAEIARLAPPVWIGAEPTFTRRTSEEPQWLSEPLGGDKEQEAHRLLSTLSQERPGAPIMRTLGRQYADEPQPRWSVGIYERRDGVPLWDGPRDPLDHQSLPCSEDQLHQFHSAVVNGLRSRGWSAVAFTIAQALPLRIVFRTDTSEVIGGPAQDERWARGSVHGHTIPLTGLVDELALEGLNLLCIGLRDDVNGGPCAVVELPAIGEVAIFASLLEVLSNAAKDLDGLILQGFPPPVDETVAWTTVTPDPAVIEVNQAPFPNCTEFLAASRELYAAAGKNGLSPVRLQYNGVVSDSGGGGQFTLGGPIPSNSPFVLQPELLPRLLRYVIRHPSLSYWFATDYVGGSSQSPRADEGVRESFKELRLALAQLARQTHTDPTFVWRSLAPFLADPAGNAHRADLNIEKFWNPHLPGRGRLGLVEFRGFRMASTPERAAAITALLRALVAMLMQHDRVPELTDWGDELHDRFALPYWLRLDLLAVLQDLRDHGLPLGEAVQHNLLHDANAQYWRVGFHGCQIQLERALEFWPLVGDVASQEGGGSRLVDASTARWQVLLRPDTTPSELDFCAWRLTCAGIEVPLRHQRSTDRELRLLGVRVREFQPWIGLHPAVLPGMPLRFTLSHPALPEALQLTLHGWQPENLPYPGLPHDLAEARQRSAERLVVEPIAAASLTEPTQPPDEAVTDYALDLRWL